MNIQYKDKIIEIEKGKIIAEALKEEIKKSEYTVVGAIYNNEYVDLNEKIDEDGKIELLDISTKEGLRTYRRTLIFIFLIHHLAEDHCHRCAYSRGKDGRPHNGCRTGAPVLTAIGNNADRNEL